MYASPLTDEDIGILKAKLKAAQPRNPRVERMMAQRKRMPWGVGRGKARRRRSDQPKSP